MGKVGEYGGGATVDRHDPNFDPDERRVDPDDGMTYKFEELAAFYKGKFTAQEIAEYWEYECSAVKRKKQPKDQKPAGPSLQESVAQAKWAKVKPQPATAAAKRLTEEDMESTGPLAKQVAAVIPYYPFKKMEKYYDVQGLLKHPNMLNAVCAVMAKHLRKSGITKLAASDAKGFLFTPLALKMALPFVMLRKPGTLPNAISSKDGKACVQRGAITKGDKVALVDDILATGTTSSAGIELVQACEAEVVDCVYMVELKALSGRQRCLDAGAKAVWSFISEDLLTLKAELPDGYKDDAKA